MNHSLTLLHWTPKTIVLQVDCLYQNLRRKQAKLLASDFSTNLVIGLDLDYWTMNIFSSPSLYIYTSDLCLRGCILFCVHPSGTLKRVWKTALLFCCGFSFNCDSQKKSSVSKIVESLQKIMDYGKLYICFFKKFIE